MKVIITGATGFIGSSLVVELLKRGWDSKNLVLLQRSIPEFKSTLIFERLEAEGLGALGDSLQFAQIDFADPNEFQAQLERLTVDEGSVVVHLAAMIHAKGDQFELQKRINIGVTKDLANFCENKNIAFVYLSSVVAFGGTCKNEIRTEDSFSSFEWANQLFPYYATKREIHKTLVSRAQLKGAILCPSIVHGAFENRKDSRGHIKALLAGRLSWAPPGGGNIVGLDRVVNALVENVEKKHSKLSTQLLVDENVMFKDYFQQIVNLSRHKSNVVKALPRPLVVLIFFCYLPFAKFWKPSALLGLFQGSLFLFFKSNFKQSDSKGAYESLKDAYLER